MNDWLVALHVTFAAIVVGTLFLQSLAVVMALRLEADVHREGVRILQGRLHRLIYYPILAVTLLTGIWIAVSQEAFSSGERWLHWKLVAVLLLIGLGLATGGNIRRERVVKPAAMAVHVLIFHVSLSILYLALHKPF